MMIVLAVAVLAALCVVTACACAARPAETTAGALVLSGAVLAVMATRLADGGQGEVAALVAVAGAAAGALAPAVAVSGTFGRPAAGGAR